MNLDQKVEILEQQLLRLQAAHLLLTAEMHALRAVTRRVLTDPDTPTPSAEEIDAAWLAQRKQQLQLLLLLREAREPGAAGKMEELLSQEGLSFPLDWD